QRPQAARGAAALLQAVAVGVVVICQLLAFPDRPGRPDQDRAILDVDVAVRVAAVVDQAGDVAADADVHDGAVRQLEAPDVIVLDVSPLALEALLIGNDLALIVDDAFVLRYRLRSVDAPPVDFRSPLFNHRH